MKRGVKMKNNTVFLIMATILLLMIPFGMSASGAKEPVEDAKPEDTWK